MLIPETTRTEPQAYELGRHDGIGYASHAPYGVMVNIVQLATSLVPQALWDRGLWNAYTDGFVMAVATGEK